MQQAADTGRRRAAMTIWWERLVVVIVRVAGAIAPAANGMMS